MFFVSLGHHFCENAELRASFQHVKMRFLPLVHIYLHVYADLYMYAVTSVCTVTQALLLVCVYSLTPIGTVLSYICENLHKGCLSAI